jgi:hypothetical protein
MLICDTDLDLLIVFVKVFSEEEGINSWLGFEESCLFFKRSEYYYKIVLY